MKKILTIPSTLAAILVISSGTARADFGQIINVDVQGGTFEGSGPILTNGNDYYPFSLASASGEKNKRLPLIENDGSFTIARLSYTADASTAINAYGSSSMAGSPYSLLFDGYMTANVNRTISLTGLDPESVYALAVYSQAETGTSTSLTINGVLVLTNPASTATTLVNGVNYALITSGITSDVNGYLAFSYRGQIDGFQLQEMPLGAADSSQTPEPSRLLLVSIGMAGLFRLRSSWPTSTER